MCLPHKIFILNIGLNVFLLLICGKVYLTDITFLMCLVGGVEMIFKANVCYDTALAHNCVSNLFDNKDGSRLFQSGLESRCFVGFYPVRSRVFKDNNTWFRFDVCWARSD